MGNLLSTFSSNLTIKKKLAIFIIFLSIYSIWRRRAKQHPTLPNRIGQHWYFGFTIWFTKHINCDDYSKIYHEEVELPTMKFNNNYKLFANCAPRIPLSPIQHTSIMIYDPELVKIFFHDQFDIVKKTDRVRGPLYELLGDGIFASDPPRWRWHRKIASRIFSMRNIQDNIYGCGLKNAQILINKLNEFRENNAQIDIHDLLGRFTLQSFVESAFGEHLQLIESSPNSHPFNDAFDETLHLFMARYGDFFWKIKRYFKIGRREKIDIPKNIEIINDFMYSVINRRQNKKLIQDESGEKYDLLSLFIKHKKDFVNNSNDTFSNKEIRDITANFIMAARDTTKVLLSWFLYQIHLEKHKHILKKLLNEIDENNNNNGNIKYNDAFKTKYKYLTATLLETLRFCPAVPFLTRTVTKDFILNFENEKHLIKAGTGVTIPTYGYARRTHIYGDDVYEFNPMRFYEKGINTFNEYEFPMFNMHPRLCLGRSVAIMQAKIVAILILRNFKINPVKNQKVVQLMSPIYAMKYGYKIKLEKRKMP